MGGLLPRSRISVLERQFSTNPSRANSGPTRLGSVLERQFSTNPSRTPNWQVGPRKCT